MRNKLSRGKFSSVFLLHCMKAIDVENLNVSEI
ncbi:MAG: DUF6471 domain-containing protein [Parasphingopyxis sp.]